jgi:hypothetical protein
MTLTTEHVKQLTAYFDAEDHEFLRGFTYITESAITTRLDEVDPNWSFDIISIERRDKQVVAICALTVCGTERMNTGMANVLDNSQSEPEKSATTDALKRCARLFGIGRYLLTLPDGVKDMPSMRKWLAATPSMVVHTQPPPKPLETAARPVSEAIDNPPEGNSKVPLFKGWSIFNKLADQLYDNPKHRENSVAKMVRDGLIDAQLMTVNEALAIVQKHREVIS